MKILKNLIKINQNKNKTNKLFLFLIFFLLFPIFKQFKYFRAYNLPTNEILLISEEGIIITDIENKSPQNIHQLELFTSNEDLKYISFNKLVLFDETYLFCRVKQFLYILSYNLYSIFYTLTISDMVQSQVSLIPFIDKNNNNLIIIAYINTKKELILEAYKILDDTASLTNKVTKTIEKDGISEYSFDYGLSCEMMSTPNYSNDLLVCFVASESNYLNVLVFDPENDFSYMYLVTYETQIENINLIKSAVYTDKTSCFICLEVNSNGYGYGCIAFNFEHQIWSEFNLIIGFSDGYEYDFEVYYIEEKNEYFAYFPFSSMEYYLYKFDINFQIIDKNEYGDECYTVYEQNNCDIKHSSIFIYSNNKYIFISSYQLNNADNFEINDINNECNGLAFFTGFELKVLSNISIADNNPTQSSTTKIVVPTTITINSSNPSIQSLITTNIESTLKSTIMIPPSTIYQLNPNKISLSTLPLTTISIYNTNIQNFNNNMDIIFYDEGEIIKGKINISRECIEDEIDEIMYTIEIGQKYKIDGDTYNITISPIDDINSFDTYVDFLECEDILRTKHNLSDEEILTIFQIEIDKISENSLTNQVEYAIYDERRNKLNLSFCQDIEIKINYYIGNNSLLNISMLSYYSDLGIDILDINDSFFNDICYPFSNSNSDIILKDRVTDIYQNFSLCDNNCDYDKIDIQNMTITCTCSIKTEISTKVDPPVFVNILMDTFKYSSFGVIKCFNLVFSFKNKIQNIGFVILFIYLIINVILFIYYFISGINSIKIFIYKEMQKYNFILNIAQPNKKNKGNKNKQKTIYVNLN